MLRMLKHSAWIPRPAVAGAVAAARRDAERTRPRVRLLDAHEKDAIWGKATQPGAVRRWQYGTANLGGYGEYNVLTGNQRLTLPVVSIPGRGMGVTFALTHNSAATTGTNAAPLSDGWTHSYHVYVTTSSGMMGNFATVHAGDGSETTFSQNMDGSYTPPAGCFDTLVKNGSNLFVLTTRHGIDFNFNSSDQLGTIDTPQFSSMTE